MLSSWELLLRGFRQAYRGFHVSFAAWSRVLNLSLNGEHGAIMKFPRADGVTSVNSAVDRPTSSLQSAGEQVPPGLSRTSFALGTCFGPARLRCTCYLLALLSLLSIIAFTETQSRLSLHVILCASGLSPWTSSQRPPVQLVAHRGCEWPYPENSLPALAHGAKHLKFVELDIAVSSDREIVLMHDETLERTSNGSGVLCRHSLKELQSFALSKPTQKPSADTLPAAPIPCGNFTVEGMTTECVYRIPTLDEVFKTMPDDTRYMLDAKVCHIDGVLSSSTRAETCNRCKDLVRRTKELMSKYHVEASRTVFTSTDIHSLSAFGDAFPQASLALSVDHHYAAHTSKQLLRILDTYQFDSAAIYFGTAALRPDLVFAIRSSRNAKTRKLRDVYAWTVRQEAQARIALCAGVDSFIVADPALWSMHDMVRVSTCPGKSQRFHDLGGQSVN